MATEDKTTEGFTSDPAEAVELVGVRRIMPLNRLTCDRGNLRAIFFVDPSLGGDVMLDRQAFENQYSAWLRGEQPLILIGIARVEFYELEAPAPLAEVEGICPKCLGEKGKSCGLCWGTGWQS